MHSKFKGNIGQFETASFLAKNGFSIFTEEGDISKIDLIAERNGIMQRIQCKAITPKGGYLALSMRKCGPGKYSFYYKEEMFDWFSVYDLVNDKLYFVSYSLLKTNTNKLLLKLSNSRQSNSHLAENYLAEKQILSFS